MKCRTQDSTRIWLQMPDSWDLCLLLLACSVSVSLVHFYIDFVKIRLQMLRALGDTISRNYFWQVRNRLFIGIVLFSMTLHCFSRIGLLSYLYQQRHEI